MSQVAVDIVPKFCCKKQHFNPPPSSLSQTMSSELTELYEYDYACVLNESFHTILDCLPLYCTSPPTRYVFITLWLMPRRMKQEQNHTDISVTD